MCKYLFFLALFCVLLFYFVGNSQDDVCRLASPAVLKWTFGNNYKIVQLKDLVSQWNKVHPKRQLNENQTIGEVLSTTDVCGGL